MSKLQPKRLSPDEIEFVKAKVAGKSDRQATKVAKPNLSESSLGKVANRLSTNVNIQEEIAKAFERKGITIDKAVQPIADGLEATKTIVMGKESNESFVDIVPDHPTRLKAAGMAFNLMGAGRVEAGATTINNFIVIAGQDKDAYGL